MTSSSDQEMLTVALVHGAFADSSSWNGVIERLENHNVPVTTIPNPLRGISIDSAYVRSALEQVPGRVLAVGHSYGGAVITNAATGLSNVVGLVYVAAFAPEQGETLLEVDQGSRDSVLFSALVPRQYPTADGTATEFSIDPPKTARRSPVTCRTRQIALIAATQRPISELAFGEPSGPAAWKSLPSWAVVPTGDKAIGTDIVRFYAERAGAAITELEGSHVIMISQPQAVTDVIESAIAKLA